MELLGATELLGAPEKIHKGKKKPLARRHVWRAESFWKPHKVLMGGRECAWSKEGACDGLQLPSLLRVQEIPAFTDDSILAQMFGNKLFLVPPMCAAVVVFLSQWPACLGVLLSHTAQKQRQQ